MEVNRDHHTTAVNDASASTGVTTAVSSHHEKQDVHVLSTIPDTGEVDLATLDFIYCTQQ